MQVQASLFRLMSKPYAWLAEDGLAWPKHKEPDMTYRTVAQAAKFMSHNPTLLATFGGYRLYEHPTRGDTAPIYMTTPDGTLINTGFYDLGDFAYHDLGDGNPEGLALCVELESDHINAYQELGAFEEEDSAKESAQSRWLHHESEDTLDLY